MWVRASAIACHSLTGLDKKDRLTNDQTETVRYIEFAQVSVCKVYVKFSDN